MYSYTASSILGLAKIYACGGSSEPVYPSADADWYSIISSQYRSQVYPRMLRKGGESWVYKKASTSILSGTATYVLSATTTIADGDFLRMRALSLNWTTNDAEPVHQLEERQRARMAGVTWGRDGTKGYYLRGDTLEFVPTPTQAVTATIVYVPKATVLDNSTDTIYGPEGLDEVLALETAVRVRDLQNEDSRALQMSLARAYEAFDEACQARQNDDPTHRMVDVETNYDTDDICREPRA